MKLPAARVTWLAALFLLGYVGAEVALGGWIVTFMLRVRHGGEFASGMTATGFWLGITAGRVILGFVTGRIGEKLAIAVQSYLSIPNFHFIILTESSPDLPPNKLRPPTPVLARPTILRLRRRCLARGLLPGAYVPCCHGRVHETPAKASPRQRHWVRGSIWRQRRRHLPVCCGSDRAGKGRPGAPANHRRVAGGHLVFVDVFTSDREETRVDWVGRMNDD